MRRMNRMNRMNVAAAVLASLLLAGPLAAYTVYLKDGKTILAKGKYKVVNGRALITLPNGTQTSLDAGEIDVRKTDEANRSDLGNAVIVEGRSAGAEGKAVPPAQRTLSEFIATREPGPRGTETPKSEARRETAGTSGTAGRLTKTRAGFPDLSTAGRKPYANLDVATQLQQYFRGQSIEGVEIYGGTQGDRVMLEITTNSEASVFRALTAAANALLHVREQPAARVAALELLLTTPQRERAGQFLITPELASDLLAQKLEVSAFFIQNVQF